MREPWKELIRRYADGRTICNCGEAYYSLDGVAWKWEAGKEHMTKITDHPVCKNGCQANQFAVKKDIAEKVLAELQPISVGATE